MLVFLTCEIFIMQAAFCGKISRLSMYYKILLPQKYHRAAQLEGLNPYTYPTPVCVIKSRFHCLIVSRPYLGVRAKMECACVSGCNASNYERSYFSCYWMELKNFKKRSEWYWLLVNMSARNPAFSHFLTWKHLMAARAHLVSMQAHACIDPCRASVI